MLLVPFMKAQWLITGFMREWKNIEDTGAKVVVDSAFKIGTKYYLVKSSQQDPLDYHTLLLNRAATSIRQLHEWGMRMIEGSFSRLKDPPQIWRSRWKEVYVKANSPTLQLPDVPTWY